MREKIGLFLAILSSLVVAWFLAIEFASSQDGSTMVSSTLTETTTITIDPRPEVQRLVVTHTTTTRPRKTTTCTYDVKFEYRDTRVFAHSVNPLKSCPE